MLRYAFRRLLQLPFPVLLVTVVVFVVMQLSGDPVDLLLGLEATEEQRVALRTQLGMDDPVVVQYFRFLGNAIQGDFGDSLRFKQPALELVFDRLPNTLSLAGLALFIAATLGILLGVIASQKRGSLLDLMITSLSVLGQSMPSFWIGIMFIMLFSVKLNWLPSSGSGSVSHMILPSITLALFMLPQIMLLMRSAMLDVMQETYVTTARAKGLNDVGVVYLHALKNALHPVITFIGLQLGTLIGGSIITESIFSWPGVGHLMIQSIKNRDVAVVEAAVVIVAIAIVLSNLLADIVNAILDPRIRAS